MDTFYFPKGSVCKVCIHSKSKECYSLPFSTMPIMEKVNMKEKGTAMIVKCTKFKRAENKK